MIEKRDGTEDFNMFDSHAIMKYICYSKNLPEQYYPRNAESLDLQAKVDMYLNWHHSMIRLGATHYILKKYAMVGAPGYFGT